MKHHSQIVETILINRQQEFLPAKFIVSIRHYSQRNDFSFPFLFDPRLKLYLKEKKGEKGKILKYTSRVIRL